VSEMITRTPRRRATAIAATIAALAFGLVACGGEGGVEGGGNGDSGRTVELRARPSGNVTISNWPYYIDRSTVRDFERATGVSVKYVEDVNDNAEFFGKMQPLLQRGQSGGRSMFVVTDWMANRMHELGYLQEFDRSPLRAFEANLITGLQSPAFDPERSYSAPWQSGMTGIIVRRDLAPDVRSVCDLFEPRYRGKVTMLTELYDTVPLVMKCEGIDPDEASEDDWMRAIDRIGAAAESGQIRRFTGNDYGGDLTSGNSTAIIGWSGDAVQLQPSNRNIEWRMPTEGCILWSDNMVIPVGAPNATAAEAFLDFVYQPRIAAQIAAEVNFVSPVRGVRDVLAETDPELANNQLIFPSDEFTRECSTQPSLTGAREQRITRAYNAVLTGSS
jgi:spermidine/putrescine transport system substrate-binding protein